ncbi:MAG: LytR C-terminal domain-containing protein [Balneolaceae bacterium]|nr:LytR C-terminal domain-containing protein [Balneolaceae bacterium]
MSNISKDESSKHLFLNSVIGFLGVLLLILLVALFSRILYPRIVTDRIQEDPSLISEVIQLEVLNGCGITGIATRFTDKLREYGFDVVETGNYDHFDVSKTFIISRSGQMENAYRVADALGVSHQQVLREQAPEYYLDVTLIIGSDYQSLNLH